MTIRRSAGGANHHLAAEDGARPRHHRPRHPHARRFRSPCRMTPRRTGRAGYVRPISTIPAPRNTAATTRSPTRPMPREDGRPLRPEYATRHFQALARAAGLPGIRLHDLRHTSPSLALAAGIDTKVVSERLGHATVAITADLHTHVITRLEREAATKLGEALRLQPQDAVAYEMCTRDPSRCWTELPRTLEARPRRRPLTAFPLVRGLLRRCLNERARRDSNPQPSDP